MPCPHSLFGQKALEAFTVYNTNSKGNPGSWCKLELTDPLPFHAGCPGSHQNRAAVAEDAAGGEGQAAGKGQEVPRGAPAGSVGEDGAAGEGPEASGGAAAGAGGAATSGAWQSRTRLLLPQPGCQAYGGPGDPSSALCPPCTVCPEAPPPVGILHQGALAGDIKVPSDENPELQKGLFFFFF